MMVPMRRPTSARSLDAGLAAALVLLGLATVPFIEDFRTVDKPMDAFGLALIVLAGAATAARRRWPVPTLVVVTAAVSAYLLIGYPYGPVLVAVAVAVYSVARRLPLPAAARVVRGRARGAAAARAHQPRGAGPARPR